MSGHACVGETRELLCPSKGHWMGGGYTCGVAGEQVLQGGMPGGLRFHRKRTDAVADVRSAEAAAAEPKGASGGPNKAPGKGGGCRLQHLYGDIRDEPYGKGRGCALQGSRTIWTAGPYRCP